MNQTSPVQEKRLPMISDATLRDSAHMAAVEFTPGDAATISSLLNQIGVNLIEVGMVSGKKPADAPLITAVHDEIGAERCLTLVMVRSRKQVAEALDEATRLGCHSVMLSIPTSAQHAELKLASPSESFLKSLARTAITEAKNRDLHVTFSGEDGARTEPSRLVSYVASGFEAGADRFRLAETVATLRSRDCADLIRPLAAIDGAEIEMHSHNMLGMAVGNSLAAFDAGAAWISTSVGGIGERGGNTPLAELLCALRVIYGDDRYDLSHLTGLTAEAVSRAGFGAAFMSGPTTEHAYAYELPGQLTHPAAYETIPAETVGNQRSLRVRSRISPALVEVALAGDGSDIDTAVFSDWLGERQERCGRPILDDQAIRELANEFSMTK